jgi:CheY-like chemotaxis protein
VLPISGAVSDLVKKKILIVDDEPAIADTLDYVLRTDGFEPVCVGLGQLALKEIKTNEYALVILDIGLPDISGFDVCRELRRHSNVPVIFLTARSDEVDRMTTCQSRSARAKYPHESERFCVAPGNPDTSSRPRRHCSGSIRTGHASPMRGPGLL